MENNTSKPKPIKKQNSEEERVPKSLMNESEVNISAQESEVSNNSETIVDMESAAGPMNNNDLTMKEILDQYEVAADPFAEMKRRTGNSGYVMYSERQTLKDAFGEDLGAKIQIGTTEGAFLTIAAAMSMRRGHGFDNQSDLSKWNNFHWTASDLMWLLYKSTEAMNKRNLGTIKPLTFIANNQHPRKLEWMPDADGVYGEVWFEDNSRRFIIREDGVFEGERGQRINNTLLVHLKQDDKSRPTIEGIHAEDLVLLNSYGTFGTWFINYGAILLSKPNIEAGKLFDKYLLGEDGNIPIVALKDVGAPDEDRAHYDEYRTQVRFINPAGPFFPLGLRESGEKVYINANPEKSVSVTDKMFESYKLDPLIFEKFNLVNYKGDFIDGRLVVVRAIDIPESYRSQWLDAIAEQTGYDRSEMGDQTVIALSSKIAKAVKRTVMDMCQCGEPVEMQGRGLKLYSQTHESQYNAVIPAVISQTLIAGAGVAMYWGENPPVLRNPHCSRRQLDIAPLYDGAGLPQVEFEIQPESITVENGWNIARWANDSVQMREGTVVAKVPYAIKGGVAYKEVKSDIDCEYLSALSWRTIPMNKIDTLVVKLDTFTLEETNKVRNNVKAMLTPSPKSYIHNGLNGDIEADSLFPRDTNKWSDLVKGNLDVAAATFIGNKNHELCQRGYQLVLEANTALGSKATDYLEYSPVMAIAGQYQEILKEFEFVFGQPIWQKVNCQTDGDWAKHLKNQYISPSPSGQPVSGWSHIENVDSLGVIPKGSAVEYALAQGEESDPKSNILVCYQTPKNSYVVLQRGWSYAGPTGCPVLQPVKLEVASVATAISKGHVMAGVARNIYKDNPEVGMSILKDSVDKIHKSAATVALAQGLTLKNLEGTKLPSIDIFKDGEATSEGLSLLSAIASKIENPNDSVEVLKTFKDELKDVVLKFEMKDGAFSLWLPLLLSDKTEDFRDAFSVSAQVAQLLYPFASGYTENKKQIQLGLNRISKGLKSQAMSDSMVDVCAFGRAGVYAKPVAIAEVPVAEVWVKSSENKTSVAQMLQSVNKLSEKNVDGMQVALSRAPMTQAAYLKVKVVGENHWAYKTMSHHVMYLNPLTCAIHGGDQDGDINFLVSTAIRGNKEPMQYLTLEKIYDLVAERTGSNQLASDETHTFGSVYYADHNEIKSLASIDKKAGLQKANISTIKQFGGMIERSSQTLTAMVGGFHRVALSSDIYQTLSAETQKYLGYKPESWQSDSLKSVLYEMYEIPLAGLDESLYNLAFNDKLGGLMIPVKGGFSAERLEKMNKQGDEAGMNSSYLAEIISAFGMTDIVRSLITPASEKSDKFAEVESVSDPITLFNLICTNLSVQISKGDLTPSSGNYNRMMAHFSNVLGSIDDQVRAELIENSPVLWPLVMYRKHIMPAQVGVSPRIDLENILKSNTVDLKSQGEAAQQRIDSAVEKFLGTAKELAKPMIKDAFAEGKATALESGDLKYSSKYFDWVLRTQFSNVEGAEYKMMTQQVEVIRKDGSQVLAENITPQESGWLQAMIRVQEEKLHSKAVNPITV